MRPLPVLHAILRPLLLLLLSCVPHAAYAGAWTQASGQLQTISSVSYSKISGYYDWRGASHPQAPYYQQEASYYLEYGLRDGLTLGGKLRLLDIYQYSGAARNRSASLGDTELFTRHRLWEAQGQVLSVQPTLLLPSPDKKTATPKIGSDALTYGAKLAYGKNFTAMQRQHYVSLSAGGLHRAGPAHDQWIAEATLGLTLDKHWQLLPQLFLTKTIQPVRNGRYSQSSADDYNLSKAQIALQYDWKNHGKIQLGGFMDITGKNTGKGRGLLLSYLSELP